jgi:hypothetical protein
MEKEIKGTRLLHMIDIFWTSYVGNEDNRDGPGMDLLKQKLVPVIEDLKNDNHIRGKGFNGYTRCPSYPSFFKNTFVIKANYDLILHHTVDSMGNASLTTPKKRQEWFNENIWTTEIEKEQQLVQLFDWKIFLSDNDVSLSVMPAFLHSNTFTNNVLVLPGKMNISKWFRPVSPAFIMKSDKVELRHGDALFYVQFHTKNDVSVNFKHFEYTEEIRKYEEECMSVKKYKPKMGLKKLYSLFIKRGYDKKILSKIKENLTDF